MVDVHGRFKLRVYESISWIGAWVEDGVGDACCGEGCLFYEVLGTLAPDPAACRTCKCLPACTE